MKKLPWLALTAVVLMALFAPLALDAQEVQDYAQREAQALDLENFEGGASGGVILAVALIAAVVVLVALIIPW